MTSIETLDQEYNRVLADVARHYRIPEDTRAIDLPSALEEVTDGRLHNSNTWILSGISGSGKSTVVKVLERNGITRLPNVVTRPKRPEESDQDNVFVDDDTFLSMDSEGKLFHPHITNGVRHALLKADIERLVNNTGRFYLDKSVTSVIELLHTYPRLESCNLLYLLAPSFKTLHERITLRENDAGRTKKLSETEILARFEEEIEQLGKSVRVPYAYMLNDSVERIEYRIIARL